MSLQTVNIIVVVLTEIYVIKYKQHILRHIRNNNNKNLMI